jgi:hypothetical protein
MMSLQKQNPQSVQALAKFYAKKSGLDVSLFHAFVKAMLYEPANHSSSLSPPIFVHNPPKSLPSYLEEFVVGAVPPIMIDSTVS